jgi:hypothetical protein
MKIKRLLRPMPHVKALVAKLAFFFSFQRSVFLANTIQTINER